jgi:CubicO group peptidase (beta-lactamase class C family)
MFMIHFVFGNSRISQGKRKDVFIFILLLILQFSCTEKNCDTIDTPFCPVPQFLDDGWNVASMDEVGLDTLPIINMLKEIDRWKENLINGILIVKDEKLVFEKYYQGHVFNFEIPGLTKDIIEYKPETLHFLASQSKSVTSLLFGIALDRGLIHSTDDSITSYFSPEYTVLIRDGKEAITIKHLLTMSSGLPWNEEHTSTSDIYRLFRENDPIYYLLSQQLEAAPGQKFHYNSGGTNLLGEIIRRATGQNLRQFAMTNLFTPLDINNFEWKTISGEHIFASGGLFLTPRDLAKIGQLCLNMGEWNGSAIISKKWLEESTRSWIYPTELGIGNGYGYQWWLNDFNVNGKHIHSYFAAGWGEQLMFIVPEENMIVLFFGEYYDHSPQISIHLLMNQYILKACQ